MKVLNCKQGSKEWIDARKGVATASNAHRIISPSKGILSASADDYACELVAVRTVPSWFTMPEEQYQSPAMVHGVQLESEARSYFELETGKTVRTVGFVLSDDGRTGCSPDGVIGEGDALEELLELKCPMHKTQVRYLHQGELPDEYKPQVHWALAVTGAKACYFMSYASGLPKLLLRIEPDKYTELVRQRMAEFFALYDEIKAAVDQRKAMQ